MKLELERELTERRFADVGRPYRVIRDDAWQLLAISSGFGPFGWWGRTACEGQEFFHRLSIHSSGDAERVAVLNTRFPINDVAFHPTEMRIAVATGSYDGGYLWQGELILWDWANDEHRSLLLESREIVRCRWEGEKIAFLFRPPDEQFCKNAYGTYFGLMIDPAEPVPHGQYGLDPRLSELEPCNPGAFGFVPPPPEVVPWPGLPDSEERELRELGFEERHAVRDILWRNQATFAVVHDKCLVEIWDIEEGRQAKFGGVGRGVQLFPHAGEDCLVHVVHDPAQPYNEPPRSFLYKFGNGNLMLLREFDHAVSFSIDSTGYLLGHHLLWCFQRDRQYRDVVIKPDGRLLIEQDLAVYALCEGRDLPALLYLRGTPPGSYGDKVLCRVDRQGDVRDVLKWDDENVQRGGALCVFVSESEMIRACATWAEYRPRGPVLERVSIETGELSWSIPLEGSATSLTHLPEVQCVAFAQANGTLGLVDTDSGEIYSQFRLLIDGVATIPTALAAKGNRLLLGTIDGRILLYEYTDEVWPFSARSQPARYEILPSSLQE